MSAVHDEFGLSYANYFVVPRSILEAMPDEWQERFVGIMRELHEEFDFEPEDPYQVTLRREGKFVADRLSEYRRPDRAFIRITTTEGVGMSKQPKRIQRRRTKGWTMPENTVYVGRPTRWGNPYRAGMVVMADRGTFREMTAAEAVHAYREKRSGWFNQINLRAELRGRDLACWCPLDQPCHADVLLEWANAEPGTANGEPGTESTP